MLLRWGNQVFSTPSIHVFDVLSCKQTAVLVAKIVSKLDVEPRAGAMHLAWDQGPRLAPTGAS